MKRTDSHETRKGSTRLYVVLSTLALAACEPTGQTPEDGATAGPVVQSLPSPAPDASGEPHLSLAPDGALVMSWQESTADHGSASLHYARWSGDQWTAPLQVAAGEDWFVNWADFPSVQPMAGGGLAAHWLVKREGGPYAYDVWMAQSADGVNWTAPYIAHDDGTASEHGFVSLFPWAGQTGAVWLDGRNTAGGGHDHEGHGGGGMTLRFGRFGPDGVAGMQGQVDDLVCDCCQTDVALLADGPVVAYRDRSEAEMRDIAVRRFDGQGWSDPVMVDDEQWHMTGCPVNGPAIAARDEAVAVAWFTGAGGTGKVKVAVSSDGGRHFDVPVIVDGQGAKGRVDVDWLDDGDLVVSWMGRSPGKVTELRARRLHNGRHRGEPLAIAPMNSSRRSGFPQMVRQGPDLVFAWTEVEEENTRVRLARVPVAALE